MNESRRVKRGDPTAVKTLSFTSHHREDWRGCVFLICDIHAAFPSMNCIRQYLVFKVAYSKIEDIPQYLCCMLF